MAWSWPRKESRLGECPGDGRAASRGSPAGPALPGLCLSGHALKQPGRGAVLSTGVRGGWGRREEGSSFRWVLGNPWLSRREGCSRVEFLKLCRLPLPGGTCTHSTLQAAPQPWEGEVGREWGTSTLKDTISYPLSPLSRQTWGPRLPCCSWVSLWGKKRKSLLRDGGGGHEGYNGQHFLNTSPIRCSSEKKDALVKKV